jgi:hypothetical protein
MADGCIMSSEFETVGEGMRALPLLALTDFIVEITPTMADVAAVTAHGSMAIQEAIFRFQVRDEMEVTRIELMLWSATKICRPDHHHILQVRKEQTSQCLVCRIAQAVETYCTCERPV